MSLIIKQPDEAVSSLFLDALNDWP